MAYATYSYYLEHYKAVSSEAEFDKLAHRASRRLDVLTGQRAAGATGYKAAALADAVCNMVDYLKVVDDSGQGKGITHISNDGYEESYAAGTPEAVDAGLRSIAFEWLSGTGLMGAFQV